MLILDIRVSQQRKQKKPRKMPKFQLFFLGLLLILLVNCECQQEKANKIIWIYWEPLIQNSPLTVQLCYENIKSAGENEGWQIILLNNNTYASYVPNITHFKLIYNQSQHQTSRFQRLLALTILKYHGGLWIDINTIMIHGFKWLQNFQDLNYLLTNLDKSSNQTQPDLVLPYSSYYQSYSQKRDSDGSLINYLPGYKYGFIFARKDTNIINLWLKNYERLYTSSGRLKRLKQIQKSWFYNNVDNEEFEVEIALYEIIQQRQVQLDESTTLFAKRKNANTEFNIIGFHAEYGPMTFNLEFFDDLTLAMTHSLKEIEQQYLFNPNFFVTFNPQHKKFFQQKLISLVQLGKERPQIYSNFTGFLKTEYAALYCQNFTFIVEGSIIAELVKNNSVAAKNNLHTITIEERDQWQSYCNQNIANFNIKSSHQYQLSSTDEDINTGRRFFYKLLNWVVSLHLISGASRSAIRDYFQAVNWKSSYSDVREVYYWKIIHQHENDNSIKQEYSWFDLKILYLKLRILSNRVIFARFYQILCTMITYSWNLISIIFLAASIIKLICILLRYHKNIIKWLVKLSWGLLRQGEVDLDIRWDMLQIYKSLFRGRVTKRWKVMGRAVKFVKEFFIGMALGIIVVLFYCWTIVVYEEICFNGNTHFQQPWLISIIITKIILSKLVHSFNHPNPWQILGLSNKQLFNFMLPIYYFCLGSCLIEFGWLREDQIFAPAFLLCGVVPIAIKEVESMANKLISRNICTFNRTRSNKKPKIFNKMLKLCSKLTNYPQKTSLVFLFVSILLPNLRYFYLSCENNDLILRKLFIFLLHSSKYIIFLIFFLYVHEILQMSRQLLHQWMNNKILGKQKRGDENTAEIIMLEQVLDEMYREEQNKKEEIIYEQLEKVWVDMYWMKNRNMEVNRNMNNSEVLSRSQPTSSRIIICPMFFHHLFVFLITVLRHLFNFYIFYLLLVEPLPGLIVTQYMSIQRLKMISIALMMGINFQVQHCVEKMQENIFKKSEESKNRSAVVNSTITMLTQERRDKKINNRSKLNHFEHHSIIIMLISFIIFEWQRMNVVNLIVKYCEGISNNKFEQQLEFESEIRYLLKSTMLYTLLGFVAIRAFVKYYLRGEEVNFLKRGYYYLLREQEAAAIISNSFCTYLTLYLEKLLCVIKKHTSQRLKERKNGKIETTVPQLEEQQLANDNIQ